MSSLDKVPRIPAVMTRSRPSTSDFVSLLLTVFFCSGKSSQEEDTPQTPIPPHADLKKRR